MKLKTGFLLKIAMPVCLLLCASSLSMGQQGIEKYKVQWHRHAFYTNRPLPAAAASLTVARYPDNVDGYYFVQFNGPVTNSMKSQVTSAGGTLLEYVPNNCFIVRMSASVLNRVRELPVVQWVGIYQPAFRLSDELKVRLSAAVVKPKKEPGPLKFAKPDTVSVNTVQLTMIIFKGENLENIRQAVVAAGGTVMVSSEGKMQSKIRVSIARGSALALARINGVMWIEEFKMPRIYNDAARGVMHVDALWTAHGLRGGGQIVGLTDTGLDLGVNDATMHDDMEGRIVNIFSWPVQAGYGALNTGADDGASDLSSGHGTHTTGSAVGNGTASGGTYSGVAQDASLVFQAVEQYTDLMGTANDGYYLTGIPTNLYTLFQQSYDAGVRIHSNSWGSDAAGAYTGEAQDVDEFVWDHPDMMICFSAGNPGADDDHNDIIDAGSVGSPGTAKNCLTVGASENNRPTFNRQYLKDQNGNYYQPLIRDDITTDNINGMAAFSGRGPTDDGRFKPDVVAPGTMVLSTRTHATPNTVFRTDDMEGGTGLWTAAAPWAQVTTFAHSATHSWHDSPAGNYANNANVTLSWSAINLGAGTANKMVELWCRYDLGTGDQWTLEVADPVVGSGSLTFTGSHTNWEPVYVLLGPWATATNLTLRFRLTANNDGVTGDGLYVDDVRIIDGAFGGGIPSDFGLTPLGSVVDQNYMFMDGTSMSTPLTAGAAAIVRQYYTDVVGLHFVSAALIRATLINGAAEMSPGQYGVGATREMNNKPNGVEGWGRVDLEHSLFPAAPAILDHVDELAGLETGDTRTYSLNITDNTVPVAITMVYHDFPGAGIQNDLDMSVTTPGGATLYPNGLAGPDANNNVEQIVIAAPAVGTYSINVHGQIVPHGPQPYAIVTSGGGTIITRDPVDVMLVLDKSGSMLDPACPTCDQKLQVLKDAVELFIQLWTAVAVPDDRLGTTYFMTNISEFLVGGQVLLPVLPNAAAMIADVQAQTTVSSNLTAMGGGLQSAINRLTDAARPRNIILFTNGMQNVNPMVHRLAGTALDIEDEPSHTHSNVYPTVPPTNLDMALGIKVNTIGVGAPASYFDLLEDIASETGGLSKLTTAPDEDLRRFYVEELIDVLRDYSPQLLAYRHGTMAGSNAVETFTANNGARNIIFKLSWKRGSKFSFQVEKDGIDLTRRQKTLINGPFYRIISFDLPLDVNGTVISPGGDWRMKISGTNGASYEAAAITEEPLLEYDFSLGKKDYTAGDPMELAVKLTYGRRPVIDAAKVTATVLMPNGQGMGTILSTMTAPAEPPGYQYETASTPGQKKFQLLLKDANFYNKLKPVGTTVTLQNKGGGKYSAVFPNTNVAGTYTVVFNVEGERTDIGKYRRTEVKSATVRFGKAEAGVSGLGLQRVGQTADMRNMLLRLRPKDRFGNYLGPDYGDRISVALSAGTVGQDKRDLADGSYTVPISYPPTSDPVVTVSVMGQPLYQGPASGIGGECRNAVSLHIGRTIPVGDFDSYYDPGLLLELDYEYYICPCISLEGVLGRYTFDPGSYGITGGTAYIKGHVPVDSWDLFAAAGAGMYKPQNVNSISGLSGGIGAGKLIQPAWKAELGIYYFHLFNGASHIDFFGIKAGIKYMF